MIELRYNYLQWFKRHHFIYIFVFLVNFNPIHSFIYETVISKNITEQEYFEDIYPISSYTSAVMSIVVLIIIAFYNFNYVFIFNVIGMLVYSTFLWKGLNSVQMKVAEGLYGFAIATEVIYYTSIYICEDVKKNFEYLSAIIRAIPLCAKTIGGIISQAVIADGSFKYEELAFLGVPACVHSIFLLMHFPPMQDIEESPANFQEKLSWFKIRFKESFLKKHVVKWSLWYAFTIAGYARVSSLLQPFWKEAQLKDHEIPCNGAIEAVSAFLALLGVLLSATLNISNLKREGILLSAVSVIQSSLLFGFANTDSVWNSTIFYIIFEIIHHFFMSSLSAMIAINLYPDRSFGIVFGCINVFYLVLNLIAVCVFNSNFVNLTIPSQFMIYGCYYMFIAFLTILLTTMKM